MRLCSTCKKNPVRSEKQYSCSSCHNKYQKEYYKKNPDSINNSAKRRKIKIRKLLEKEKDKPCMDCGKKYPFYVMDFDHVKGKKLFNLSTVANRRFNIKQIVKEIKKCEVVCSNCHRIRTFKRLGYGVNGKHAEL